METRLQIDERGKLHQVVIFSIWYNDIPVEQSALLESNADGNGMGDDETLKPGNE